jgi:hypothetical protein
MDILATLASYAAAANQHLDAVLRKAKEANPDGDPVRDLVHYDVVHDWCRNHPDLAAKVVLAVVYLTSSRCAVQVEQDPPAEPATPDVVVTAAAPTTDDVPAPA